MSRIGVLVLLVLSFGSGIAVQKFVIEDIANIGSENAAPEETKEAAPLYWVAPMDANYRRDKPGKSPMGMDLVPVYESDNTGADEGTVVISPAVETSLGVRTAEVERGPIKLEIETVGYVDFDEDTLQHIHSRVDGWIEVLNVTSTGNAVTKGQTLYEVYSPALVNAQEEYLSALRSGNKTLKDASQSRLGSLGISRQQIQWLDKHRQVKQRIKVKAEQNGFIEKLNVREGMYIKPSTEVMSIGSLDTVWVIAEVFERQASWVKPGQKVVMTTDANPGEAWEGFVDYLYPVLDRKTRTLRVRVRFENNQHILKPNMFTNLLIYAPVSEDAISIPREALIRGGRYDRVVLSQGDGKFKSVLVSVGLESGDRIEIVEGLSQGDRVVTSAQFLIDSESNIDAEIERMNTRENKTEPEANAMSDTVIAKGKINKVMADMAMLTITHEPIKAWEWPTMKMDFEVAQGISLDGLENGQNIEFELIKDGEYGYVITSLKQVKQ